MVTTILVVDDSKLARIVLARNIDAIYPEWERLEAGTAAEALELIEGRSVDIVVVDFNMPGRNGLDLAEDLRTRFPDMPLALATANVQDEVIARARAAKVAFVPKPVTEEGLRGFLTGAALQLRSGAS
jgi:CheY-like chemotaxis protein